MAPNIRTSNEIQYFFFPFPVRIKCCCCCSTNWVIVTQIRPLVQHKTNTTAQLIVQYSALDFQYRTEQTRMRAGFAIAHWLSVRKKYKLDIQQCMQPIRKCALHAVCQVCDILTAHIVLTFSLIDCWLINPFVVVA